MDDATAALAGHTKKYNIPLSHFENKYIENCTDGKELERIYKELIGGEIGSFPALEQLALDRIRDVKPNSQTLRQDKAPLDKSALPDDERQHLNDFLNQMKETKKTSSIVRDHPNNGIESVPIRSKSIVGKSILPVSTTPVINNNGKQKRIVPRSYAEWGKLDQKISQECGTDEEDDEDEKIPNKSRPADQIPEKSQRLHMAEQHRLNGNTAFKSNNYQQSIDLYTKSITLDTTNPVVYMNRAIAHYKLNHYDESITDCSQVLSNNPNHIKALFRRASCLLAKRQYEEARRDLDILLSIESDNDEAKKLLKTIPTVQKTKGVRIPITEDDDDEQVETQPSFSAPVKIPILEVEEEEEEVVEQEEQPVINQLPQTMNIDIPQKSNLHARPCIDSQEASPAMLDHHFHHRDDVNQFQQDMQFQLSSLDGEVDNNNNDEDDDMALGDEAGVDLVGNMSDDDGSVSPGLNDSPTMDVDSDVPELVDHEPLIQTIDNNRIDHSIANTLDDTYNRKDFTAISSNQSRDEFNNSHGNNNNNVPTVSNNYSSHKQNTVSSNPFETDDNSANTYLPQRSSTTNLNDDRISNSNFGPIIQSWLRDFVILQSARRPSSFNERPWSKSERPWSLDKLQRDIERFNRTNNFKDTIEASKKMLKNGVLDYHLHAEHIVNTLVMCAQCCSKTNEHKRAIQYATEALQYNKKDSNALTCRGKAFENEKFLLFSYADYARIPPNDYSYSSAQQACERLSKELNITEGKTWREKLPKDNDDELYLTFIKKQDNYSDTNEYEWYRLRANQLHTDACFVLASQCYSHCIELNPSVVLAYLNRAACYLKVFEPQKAIDDCDIVLKVQPKNVRALYRKASAYKMARTDHLYKSILKDLVKLQPDNQTILAEYYTTRQEQIPRQKRRIRTNPTSATTVTPIPSSSSSSSDIKNSTPTILIGEHNLSFEDLEQIRTQKARPLSTNTPYQFTQEINALKSNDIKGQCSLILRMPAKSLFKFANTANAKLIETIVRVCRTMVDAEKRYQQEHKSSILPFSYVIFSFNILVELIALPRIESTLLMIDQTCRASLDDLLAYYSSISSMLNDVNKLDRLRK